jgi:hypothetical protein
MWTTLTPCPIFFGSAFGSASTALITRLSLDCVGTSVVYEEVQDLGSAHCNQMDLVLRSSIDDQRQGRQGSQAFCGEATVTTSRPRDLDS